MIRGSKPWSKVPSGGSEFSLSANKFFTGGNRGHRDCLHLLVSKVDRPLCRAMLESTPKAHESILGSAGALAITNFYGMPSLVTGLPRRSNCLVVKRTSIEV